MPLIRFNHRNFKSDRLYQFCDQIRIALQAGVPGSNEVLTRQVGKLATAVSSVGLALGRQRASKFTASKNELDANRDSLFIGLTNQIDSFLRSRIAAKQQAAHLLDVAINRREGKRRLYQLERKSNTTQLELLFKEIDDSAELTAAVATLGLNAEWYAPLKQANADYKAKEIEESGDDTPEEDPPLLNPAKDILGDRLLRILINLEDYAEDGVQPYTGLLEQVLNLIPPPDARGSDDESPSAGGGERPVA